MSDSASKAVMSYYNSVEYNLLMNLKSVVSRVNVDKHLQTLQNNEKAIANAHLQEIVGEMQDFRHDYIQKAVKKAYDKAVKTAQEDIRNVNPSSDPKVPEDDKMGFPYIMMCCNVNMKFAESQMAVNYEKTCVDLATETYLKRTDPQAYLNRIADKGITGFVDERNRNWNMTTYSDVSTVSALEKAILRGYLSTLERNGYDLVLITGHKGGCPVCTAWADVVISISGNTEGYPTYAEAVEAGVFHPHCRHDIELYRDGYGDEIRTFPRPVSQVAKVYMGQQLQRHYEAEIRRWKRRMAVSLNPETERQCLYRVRHYQKRIKELLKDDNNLVRMRWRETLQKIMKYPKTVMK